MDPKAHGRASKIAKRHAPAASAFRPAREKFVEETKDAPAQHLVERGITVREVVIARIPLPKTLAHAPEVTATKPLELQGIREKNAIDLGQAGAARRQAQAEGQVPEEKARAEGQGAEIDAATETGRPSRQVARAEAEARVLERRTRAEVEGVRPLAREAPEKRRELDRVDLGRPGDPADLEITDQRNSIEVKSPGRRPSPPSPPRISATPLPL